MLVTSGYSNLEYETEAPGSRTYFLAKPYSRRTLVEKIEKILGAVRWGGRRRKRASASANYPFGRIRINRP